MDPSSGKNATGTAQNPSGGGDTSADILGVLSDVEARLAQLKKSAADREAARRQLDTRETELHRREQALAEQSEKLRVAQEQAEAGVRGFHQREESLKKVNDEVERAQRHLDEQRTRVEETQKKVGEQADQVARDREAVESMAAELLTREQDLHQQADHGAAKARLEQLEAALAEARKAAEQHDTSLKGEHDRAINALKARAEQAEAALAETRKAVGDQETALGIERERAAAAIKRADELGKIADEKQRRVQELEQGAGQAATAGAESQKLLQKTLADRERELEEARAALWESRENLRKFKEDQETRQSVSAAAARRAQELEKRVAELTRLGEEARAGAGAASQEAESLRAALEEQRRQTQERERQVAEHQKAVAERDRAIAAKAGEAADAEKRLKSVQDELAAAQGEGRKFARAAEEHGGAAQRAADLERRLQTREAEVAKLTGALEESTGVIRKTESELQTRGASAGQQLAAAQLKNQELVQERAKLAERAEALGAQLAQREAELARAAELLGEARSVGRKAETDGQERSSAATRQIEAAHAKAREQAEHIQKLQRQLEAAERGLEEGKTGASRTAGEATAASERASRAESENSQLRAHLDRAGSELRCAKTAMEESAAATQSLTDQLQEARAQIEQMSGEMPAEVSDLVNRRLGRLRLARSLLRKEAKKVKDAGEAVRERFERAEQILAQRNELAQARGLIVEAQRKMDRLQAGAVKARAASLVLYIALILGVLGGLSWAITQEFAPATYAATCSLGADGRGRELEPEELAEWAKFHEGLVTDPQLATAAAERMNSRGMTALGTPGAVTERIKADMSTDKSDPGRLRIELRGRGAARTERELSTFVAALLSRSNGAREQRTDGIITVLAEPVSSGRGPIDDQRLHWMLIVFVGSIGGSGALGLWIWKRLAASKARFEQEAQIDAILDEANWGKLAADAINGDAPGPNGAQRPGGRNKNADPEGAGDEDDDANAEAEARPRGRGRRG